MVKEIALMETLAKTSTIILLYKKNTLLYNFLHTRYHVYVRFYEAIERQISRMKTQKGHLFQFQANCLQETD